jgi:hypothetical protein
MFKSTPLTKTSVLLLLNSPIRRWIRRSPVTINKRQERKWCKMGVFNHGFRILFHIAFFHTPKGHSKEPKALVLTIIIPERDCIVLMFCNDIFDFSFFSLMYLILALFIAREDSNVTTLSVQSATLVG